MITDKSTLNEVMEFVCENLPEDWQIQISFGIGECGIDLRDPQGRIVEICDDALSAVAMIVARLNHARNSDGLQSVDTFTGIYDNDPELGDDL